MGIFGMQKPVVVQKANVENCTQFAILATCQPVCSIIFVYYLLHGGGSIFYSPNLISWCPIFSTL